MSVHPPITRQSYGRTFTVAGAALGAIALLQVGAVTWRFFQQSTDAPQADAPLPRIDIAKIIAENPPPEDTLIGKDPLENEPVVINEQGVRPVPLRPDPVVAVPLKPSTPPEATASESPAVAVPFANGRPTPIPLVQLTPKVDPRFTELIEQGKLLRNSGDTAGARLKFGEASNLDPSNAQAIAELAYTFEKMSLPDKAAEQWRRVLALGENAGALYSAARAKLDMARDAAVRPVGSAAGAVEIAEGHTLALGQPVMVSAPLGDSAKKSILQLPIVARRGAQVSRGDVKILVLFYDQVNGKELDKNTAKVSSRWASPPLDWAEDQTETLEVNYDLPISPMRGERRDYYGYSARLYYKGELQATRAEPATLNQKFPAPKTLSE